MERQSFVKLIMLDFYCYFQSDNFLRKIIMCPNCVILCTFGGEHSLSETGNIENVSLLSSCKPSSLTAIRLELLNSNC